MVHLMKSGKTGTVEDYFAQIQNEDLRKALDDLRVILKEEMPDAEEIISYGIPTLKLTGPVLHYGAFAKHCSLFLGSMTEEFEPELTGFKTSKGTIQFTPENPLPEELVKKMVRRRLEMHLELLAERQKKRARLPK